MNKRSNEIWQYLCISGISILSLALFIACFSLPVQKGVVIMRVLFRYQFRLVGGHVTSRRGVYRSCPLM